ncbi:ABC transporter substrate-binding protein [Martelella radicis]|uniref:Peptide/nickel transport system substrate-binding protein n=1 Tax=Martelella radicis TaxID=1397476 RepID=A0A7W6KMC1_9HYPH|nr:ABC transporter substrate-binding protein [Martelella radicis]MBB4122465.1 peptide/nickel transport system substrate-binding protein [Martelella radicis]
MRNLSRRAFLAAGTAFAGLLALPAWADMTYHSPNLEAAVQAGDLPPVAERLPENPLVLTPRDEPGKQGGTWNHALVGGGSLSMVVRYQGYEPTVRFTPDWSGVTPNVAESFTVSEDSTEYTFTLRKGMKWSDGEPYTTDDVKFWYEDVFQNPELTIGDQTFWYSTDGTPAELEVVDDQVFKVKFAQPNGFFAQQLAWAQQDQITRTPKHYLKQFHIKYNPNANELAKERGFESWVALFQRECGVHQDNDFFQNSKRPTLNAWMFTIAPGEDTERAVAVRNPYYWKVDTEGTQLPYFDEIYYQMVGDPEVLLLKTLQGEIDMMDQYIATPANKPVLFDAQESGDFHFYTLKETAANVMVFQLNLNHTDPVKNALYNNRDFRVALSHAIDRQSMIDAVFVGQGSPAQPSIVEGDPLYVERLAKQYTEYDPEKANAILDTIIPEKDSEGYRLDSEGRRVTIIFEIDQVRTTFLDMFQLAIPNFKDVGIDAQIRTMDRSLWETRVRHGREFDATAHQFGANSGVAAMLDPRYFVPFNTNALYAQGWALHFARPDNDAAIEPPADVKAQQDLYKKLLATGDQEKQHEIMLEILNNAADQFLVFGVSLPPDGYGVVKNDMVNTMPVMPNSFGWPTPGPSAPEQFFKN